MSHHKSKHRTLIVGPRHGPVTLRTPRVVKTRRIHRDREKYIASMFEPFSAICVYRNVETTSRSTREKKNTGCRLFPHRGMRSKRRVVPGFEQFFEPSLRCCITRRKISPRSSIFPLNVVRISKKSKRLGQREKKNRTRAPASAVRSKVYLFLFFFFFYRGPVFNVSRFEKYRLVR